MNKRKSIIVTIMIILILILVLCISGIFPKQIIKIFNLNDNMNATIKAVIVKTNENNILAMGIDNGTELYSIATKNLLDKKLKNGQEIQVYFSGNILTSYPAQLANIGKIKIIKEESDISIPDDIIRFCYNSKDKVDINILKISNTDITLNISDKNDLPYNYSHSYIINKKVKNENYTGIGKPIGENTENSTAGFTRNRNRIYMERIK